MNKRLGLVLVCCTLAACGGGGGGDAPPVPPPSSDFGGTVLAKVARTGVAGNWGYTALDGSRYAIMGTAKGVLVLDLRDTANPRVVDEIDGPTDTHQPGIYWREMRVYGTHAYVVSEHSNVRGGIMIIDLAGLPASVRFVKSVIPRDGDPAAHTVDIDTARGLLYLQRYQSLAAPAALTSYFDKPAFGGAFSEVIKEDNHEGAGTGGSIEIYDIKTDPENPRYLTTFNQQKSVHDMTAVGDYVYVAEATASSYSMWDVKDPLAPKMVVRWSVAPGNFAHNIWPSGDGSFVVTTEELPNGLPAKVWQLNGSAPPTLLSSFKAGTGTPHNVVMEGRMAYLSHYSEGAVVVDLNNPSAPKIVTRVDTTPSTGPALVGCWGVYKFPGVPFMSCSDINNGYYLIGITAP
ncbi:MAG TPA: choice-of-anchor B family protein [Telluria sp.]|nr:choice-of-anchor B family protein [Telluria sp.]